MKNVAIINDLSGLGRCSMAVQLPIINTLGHTALPLPTGVFSCQSAFSSYHFTDLSEQMKNTINDWKKENILLDGIIVGFMMSKDQINLVKDCIDKLAAKDTVILVDPIIGDNGEIFSFFTNDYAKELKNIIKKANIITPNVTELCILSDVSYEKLTAQKNLDIDNYLEKIKNTAMSLLSDSLETVIVTGIKYIDYNGKELVYNLFVKKDDFGYSGSDYKIGSFSGTGDMLTALICGYILQGKNMHETIDDTSRYIKKTIDKSLDLKDKREFGTNFELTLKELTSISTSDRLRDKNQ